MHGPINVKSPNNISKWQMGFNLEFKGLSDFSEVSEKKLEPTTCRSFRDFPM
jgi:hypothetical protein